MVSQSLMAKNRMVSQSPWMLKIWWWKDGWEIRITTWKRCFFHIPSFIGLNYCGWLRNPAPVENCGEHPIFFIGFKNTILFMVHFAGLSTAVTRFWPNHGASRQPVLLVGEVQVWSAGRYVQDGQALGEVAMACHGTFDIAETLGDFGG